jgi:hypothetical protein
MGSANFMMQCLRKEKEELDNTIFESRMDSALFGEKMLSALDKWNVIITESVPFERFTQLKD